MKPMAVAGAFLIAGILLGGCFMGAVHGNNLPIPSTSALLMKASSGQMHLGSDIVVWQTKKITNTQPTIQIACPSGYFAASSGHKGYGPSAYVDAPAPDFQSWIYSSGSGSGTSVPITLYVTCAPR